ncbi:hypothetical protein JTE90_021790 [Oedothorax gibbosus]|uniref:Uncharacterized protein n=1 Tax=Oedothorax gibbosus TaxID=931172 RepID=A0AAV6TNA5_9ARAC|nr:hypothetical protein JTE90_021790 [Oedothorax gibbosus]
MLRLRDVKFASTINQPGEVRTGNNISAFDICVQSCNRTVTSLESFPSSSALTSLESFPSPSALTSLESFPSPSALTSLESFPSPSALTSLESFPSPSVCPSLESFPEMNESGSSRAVTCQLSESSMSDDA